ncbi:MAG TPA: MurT ligase domain-containing protein [Verrucomicrobiae bacterium]|nr:MurT ligase domain-containing protein [Verrucomicrobiae bacterium]
MNLDKCKLICAIWVGKLTYIISKVLGKKGTTLPGALALKVYPHLIAALAGRVPKGAIIVTGTNGKTTTSNMLAAILQHAGLRLTFNAAGANLITGVAAAFLNSVSWTGKVMTDLALLEVDEATVIKVAPMVKPQSVIITNFFRDQLDRYGELDKTVQYVKSTLEMHLPKTELILNADDPLVAQIGVNRDNVIYYGIAPTQFSAKESFEAREAKYCGLCQQVYEYDIYHYGQLGIYRCPNCGFKRPTPEYLATDVRLNEQGGISFCLDSMGIDLKHQGFYNIYNALAPAAAALNMGIDARVVKEALEDFAPQAGRMEQFRYGVHDLTLSLVKNPTGFNEVLRTMVMQQRPLGLLIAINDNAADGRDISWLWDVDFERLHDKVKWVICAGTRAEDMAVRLKYAGIDSDSITIIKDLGQAKDKMLGLIEGNIGVYVLPTYTALFPMREIMSNLRSTVYAS